MVFHLLIFITISSSVTLFIVMRRVRQLEVTSFNPLAIHFCMVLDQLRTLVQNCGITYLPLLKCQFHLTSSNQNWRNFLSMAIVFNLAPKLIVVGLTSVGWRWVGFFAMWMVSCCLDVLVGVGVYPCSCLGGGRCLSVWWGSHLLLACTCIFKFPVACSVMVFHSKLKSYFLDSYSQTD